MSGGAAENNMVRTNVSRHRCFQFLFITLLLYACSTPGLTEQGAPPRSTDTEPVSRKVDPSLLAQINNLPTDQRTGQEIDVIIRTKGQMSAFERAQIEKMGGPVSSVLGDIAVARVPVGRIADIARLDFVIYIEKAKKVYPK